MVAAVTPRTIFRPMRMTLSSSTVQSRWVAGLEDLFYGGGGDSAHHLQADADDLVLKYGAVALGVGDADGADADAPAAGVFEQGGGGVEAHGLVVE